MRLVLTILFLVITIAISFIGLIAVAATSKEGLALSDLWIFASILGIFLINTVGWLWIIKKSHSTPLKILSGIGIICIAFPSLIILLISGYILNSNYQAKQVFTETTFSDYQEQLIAWPTFSYPVGLKVELTIKDAPEAKNARFGDIVLWMGRNGMVTLHTLYDSSDIDFALIRPIPFNKNDPMVKDTRQEKDLKIVRYLYPSSIAYIQSPTVFCKTEYEKTKIARYYTDTHINGVLFWHYASATAEINEPIRQILQQSLLENNPMLWTNMNQQFEDDALLANGFQRCTLDLRKNCFCK
jgi:hypothetical protein